MEVTYYGHSCFLLDIGGYKILFDPFIAPNPLAASVKVDEIEADFVLISHGHQDHIADAEAILKRTQATLVANWEICNYFQQRGIEKVHPMNSGGKWPFEFGIVRMTQAVHSSSFADGTYAGNPNGFIIETDARTVYYSGDTDLFSDMRLIGELYEPHVAFLPVGDNFTMDVSLAMIAARFLNVSKVVGMHFDTFPYIQIDHEEAKLTAAQNEKELILPNIGETFKI